jgi:clan AA aspartic protease
MKERIMGTVYAEITIKNAVDAGMERRGLLAEKDVRKITVEAIVDTGAVTLIINDEVRRKLGLSATGYYQATYANNTKEICEVAEPVEIHWKNRKTSCDAIIVPGAQAVLLGALPLEGMDLIVHPLEEKLTGAHGDEPLYYIL